MSIHDSKIVKCDVNDIMFIMKEANNIVMTKSVGSGQGRFRNAINDAVLRCQVIAKDYNPFSAEKVLLVIGYNSRRPLSMEEFIEISTFTDMFDNKIIPVIGMYINDRNIDQDSIIINMLATNLGPKKNMYKSALNSTVKLFSVQKKHMVLGIAINTICFICLIAITCLLDICKL